MITTREKYIVSQILAKYGFDYLQVRDPERGYRNRSYPIELVNHQVANLILYKSEPGILDKIRHANAVSGYLAVQGLPVRQTLDPKIIRLGIGGKERLGSIYRYLPGVTIPWGAYSMNHLKVLGLAMGRLHTQLSHLDPPAGLPSVTNEYLRITQRMSAYFAQPQVQRSIEAKLGFRMGPSILVRNTKLLQFAATLPGQQVLHMDFVRGNILFGQESRIFQIGSVAITGILDFEKTSYGLPVVDVARTLAFLLVDCKYKPEAKIRQYFLNSGYISHGNGKLQHAQLLEPLINLFITHDFYKFLLHNPYETLDQNEHFVRTRDLMQSRGIISGLTLMVE